MDKYLSKYISNFNKYIVNEHIQYSIKGSLCLYYHYLLYHNELPNNFEQPLDIDVDVFSLIVDPIEILENVIVCKKLLINIIKIFFTHFKNNINFKDILKKAYETNTEQLLISNGDNEKINVVFEKFNERIFFGKRSKVSYSKLIFKYFDKNGNNYIDLFMENITKYEFNDLKNYIELINYENESYYILLFSTIINRYHTMYENANEERLKKLSKDISRFEEFFVTTTNKKYKELIHNLLEFLKKKKNQNGGINVNNYDYKYKYQKYKKKYMKLSY